MILDWKKIAKDIYEEIKQEVTTLKEKPKLSVILVWDNSSSIRYVNQKEKWANYTWINFELIKLKENISENELIKQISKLNNDELTNGFIVQLPLPKHIDTIKILKLIKPEKDVDWFHPENQWKIVIWDDSGLVPCTPAWVIELIERYKIQISGKNIAMIWASNIVWKPMTNLLINKEATVSVCNSKTKNISDYTKNSDIVITATWVPWLITKDIIWKNTTIIDVWFTIVDWKIYWDADFENILDNWNNITPVPGWVWAMTVAILMKNTLKAYREQNK